MTTTKSTTLKKIEESIVPSPDPKEMGELRKLANMEEEIRPTFAQLKLEHVTDRDGEPNPLRGHYTLSRKNDLGEWVKEDLGEEIKVHWLMQRYFLKMVKGDDIYSSGEFDSELESIQLWKRNTETKNNELFKEGLPDQLKKMFLKKDDKGKVYSELKKLSKLYGTINGELVAFKLSGTGTWAWSDYSKLVTFPAAVITTMVAHPDKKGTLKWYVPVFKATEKITDFAKLKEQLTELKSMVPQRPVEDSLQIEEGKEDVPFK